MMLKTIAERMMIPQYPTKGYRYFTRFEKPKPLDIKATIVAAATMYLPFTGFVYL